MKFREFVKIIEANGFTMVRQTGSHRQFKGVVDGQVRLVTVA